MDCKSIIMNYTRPPNIEDLEVLSLEVLQNIPEELSSHCDGLVLVIEDLPDEMVQDDVDVDDPFDLLVMYKSGKEVSPGVEKKNSDNADYLVLYRRSILDMWCETEDDLQSLIRQIIIEELGRCFEFSDDEIQEMCDRDY